MAIDVENDKFSESLKKDELKRIQSYSLDDLEREQQRFSYFNVARTNAFADHRLYFNNYLEIVSRLLLIFSQVCIWVLSYFFGSALIQETVAAAGVSVSFFRSLNLSNQVGFGLGFMLLNILSSTVIWLPLLIINRARAVHVWSIFFIMAAFGFFFFYEAFLITAFALSSVISLFASAVFVNQGIYFIVAVFIIALIWLVGACLLLVKSDDVRRRIDIE